MRDYFVDCRYCGKSLMKREIHHCRQMQQGDIESLRAEIARLTAELTTARQEALERCARIAEDIETDFNGYPWDNGAGVCGYETAQREIAAAIREEGK